MKKVTPFSNASEAMSWLDQNCDVCRRSNCGAKVAIQRGFISGKITERMAHFIGYTNTENIKFKSLNPKCDQFTTVRISPKKESKHQSITIPTLFQ